jgi:hypothetical protein
MVSSQMNFDIHKNILKEKVGNSKIRFRLYVTLKMTYNF